MIIISALRQLSWQTTPKAFCLLTLTVTIGLSTVAGAQDFTKGYATEDSELRPGMVVSLSDNSTPNKPLVERATHDKPDKIVGITTTIDDSLVTVASGEQSVYVQTSGVVGAFVSDLNGTVKKGDIITISPLRGVLMRGDSTTPNIGIALEDFVAAEAESQTITTDGGSKITLVDTISITLDSSIAANGQLRADSFLKRIGRAVVGKEVGEIQVIVALVIFLVVMVAEGAIIYGAVTTAITALGRNPLAKKIIIRELIRVLILVIIVLSVGLAAIYAVLRI